MTGPPLRGKSSDPSRSEALRADVKARGHLLGAMYRQERGLRLGAQLTMQRFTERVWRDFWQGMNAQKQ